jgi:hypothetical protein
MWPYNQQHHVILWCIMAPTYMYMYILLYYYCIYYIKGSLWCWWITIANTRPQRRYRTMCLYRRRIVDIIYRQLEREMRDNVFFDLFIYFFIVIVFVTVCDPHLWFFAVMLISRVFFFLVVCSTSSSTLLFRFSGLLQEIPAAQN